MNDHLPETPAIDRLCKLTGVSKPELKTLWDEVKANLQRLHTCPKHHFPPESLSEKRVSGREYTCSVCGGTMKLSEAAEYIRGYKAAGGNPNDILPGWE